MRILLLTAGSRGDVEPFLALARRAAADGHEVRLGVTREFLDQVGAAGIDVAPLDGDYSALVAAQGVSPLAALRSYRSTVAPMLAAILRSAARAAISHRPDVIVYHPKVLSARLAAARLDVPHVLAEIVPTLTPTREFPAAGVVARDLGPLNRWTYAATRAAGAALAGPLRDVRAELGLPRRGALPDPALSPVPVSPALLPRPADWPATTVLTGAWAAAGDPPAPDPELDAFLAAGDVVQAGFGSMASGDAEARGRAVVDAVRRSGRRALVVTGWGGLAAVAGPGVLVRRAVHHATVLPRCAAAVHHGGAGTVHAVVRAGLPSVTVPFLADQPFWGALLERRGLGSAPLPARGLAADRLAARLDALPGPGAVRAVAAAMAGEDGCGEALRALARLG